MDDRITCDEVIKVFVDSKATSDDEKVINLLKQKIYSDLKQEIEEEEIEELKEKAKERQKEEERKEKFLKIKILIFETLLIGFVSGLIVNQVTDLITSAKWNPDTKVYYTWICIACLIIVLGVLIFAMYLDKVDEVINKRKRD